MSVKNFVFKVYNKMGFKNLFFLFVLIIYLVVLFVDLDNFVLAVKKAFNLFFSVLDVFFIVFCFMVLMGLFVKQKTMVKFFKSSKKFLNWIFVIGLGILSTGPIYMWYPLIEKFKKSGMKIRYQACLLYNRSVKIPLMYYFVLIFGFRVFLVMIVLQVVFSVINGFIVEFIVLRLEKNE
jgi:uncharacterized membrane protein YraQ (UPF0718 family)